MLCMTEPGDPLVGLRRAAKAYATAAERLDETRAALQRWLLDADQARHTTGLSRNAVVAAAAPYSRKAAFRLLVQRDGDTAAAIEALAQLVAGWVEHGGGEDTTRRRRFVDWTVAAMSGRAGEVQPVVERAAAAALSGAEKAARDAALEVARRVAGDRDGQPAALYDPASLARAHFRVVALLGERSVDLAPAGENDADLPAFPPPS